MEKIKKRLKKLSIFDKLLLSGFFFAVIIFAYLFFRKSTYITVTVKVGSDSVYWLSGSTVPWFGRLFYPGIKELDGLGGKKAEVLNVRSYDTSPDRKAVYLTLKLKVIYNRASNQYTFRGKPVLIGSTIRLYLDKLLMDGLVTNIEGVKDERKKKTLILETQIADLNPVYAETSGTDMYIADALKEGEEIKDNLGNPVVKIIKKKIEPSERLVTTADGRILIQKHPSKIDLYLTLQLEVTIVDGKYFMFDDVPVKIGESVAINTKEISVYPFVRKILSVN